MVACTAGAAQKLPVLVSIIAQVDCLRALSPRQITRHAPKVVNIALNVAARVNDCGAGGIHSNGQICVVQVCRAISGVPITYMICVLVQDWLRVVNGCLPVCAIAVAFRVVLGVLSSATAQKLIDRLAHAVEPVSRYLVVFAPNVRFCHDIILTVLCCFCRSILDLIKTWDFLY